MKTQKVTGFFDCRVWKKDTPKAARAFVEAGNRINLSVGFAEEDLPEEAKEFAKKSSKSEMWYLTFKVFPKNCKLYNASAQLIEFPDFKDIDGGKFVVRIDYSVKHGTGTDLNGCYANAIQIIERADNPFDAEDGDDNFAEPKPVVGVSVEPQQKPVAGAPIANNPLDGDPDLPF